MTVLAIRDGDAGRLALLSVEYADTLGRYRDAHEISLGSARGEASTEQLRQALVNYRTLSPNSLASHQQPVPTPVPGSPGGGFHDRPGREHP